MEADCSESISVKTNVKTISSYFAFKCELSKNSRILNSLSFGQSSTIKQRNNEYVYF